MVGREIELHGVRLLRPEGWSDHTVHRFAAPKAAEDAPFRTNLLVTRHEGVPDEIPLEVVFTGPNTAARAQDRAFEVLRTGLARFLEQDAVFQDVRFFDAGVKRLIFQRQIGVRSGPGALVVLTLTSDRQDLDEASASIGFTAPDEKGGRSKAAAAASRAAPPRSSGGT